RDVVGGFDRAVATQDHVGDQADPPGLMEGADRGAVVAVEVLAEDQVVMPHDRGPGQVHGGEDVDPGVSRALRPSLLLAETVWRSGRAFGALSATALRCRAARLL